MSIRNNNSWIHNQGSWEDVLYLSMVVDMSFPEPRNLGPKLLIFFISTQTVYNSEPTSWLSKFLYRQFSLEMNC